VDAGKAFCVGTSGQNPSNFGLRRLDATREDQCSVTKVDEGDVAAFRNAPTVPQFSRETRLPAL
jgi:hypothetical protein